MADEKRLERIEAKLDDTNDHLAAIDTTLQGQHITLKEHIKRTAQIERELQPIRKHVYMVQGALALLASAGVIISIIRFFSK